MRDLVKIDMFISAGAETDWRHTLGKCSDRLEWEQIAPACTTVLEWSMWKLEVTVTCAKFHILTVQ